MRVTGAAAGAMAGEGNEKRKNKSCRNRNAPIMRQWGELMARNRMVKELSESVLWFLPAICLSPSLIAPKRRAQGRKKRPKCANKDEQTNRLARDLNRKENRKEEDK